MAKRVRMADIAEKLGISIVSVSKGLAGKDGVSEEMREKILETAKEMGYLPPSKSTAAQRSINIGILVADRHFGDNTFYANLYRSLVGHCNRLKYQCMLEIVMPHAEDGCVLPLILAGGSVDALVFMGEFHRSYLAAMLKNNLPFVFLDFYDDVIAGDSVQSDNVSGSFQITEHLLQTGCRKIAFVGSVRATSSIMDRYLGYCRALLQAGIEPRADWRLEDRDADGSWIPLSLPREMPDGFVCNCDEAAFNLVEKLKKAGYRIPQDIAVTGYDDHRFSTICTPQLTSYRVDVDGMANAAVNLLARKLNGKAVPAPIILVPGTIVYRESTQVK